MLDSTLRSASVSSAPAIWFRQYSTAVLLSHTPKCFKPLVSNCAAAQGDIFDVATSPNEMLLFATHHANIDRSAMIWQVRG